MKTISIIILVGKRADVIQNCLNSIKDLGKIIIVDLGMDNKTRNIVEKYKCHILLSESNYDFSLWRNQGAKAAQEGWLLYLDSDERLTKALRLEIISAINSSSPFRAGHQVSTINGYYIPRKNYFLGKFFKTTWPDYQLRLVKKSALKSWQGKVHELPLIQGEIGKLVNPIIHLSHQNLETMLTNTMNWSKIEAANRFNLGHPAMTIWRFFRIIFYGFWDNFAVKKLWREGIEGVIEGIYQVFSLFITYFRLWERQRKKSLKDTYEQIDKELTQ